MWYSAASFGYANPRLGEALKAQADKLPQLACQYLHAEKVELAALIGRLNDVGYALALEKPMNSVTYDTETVNATIEVARELKHSVFSKLKVEVVGFPKATVKPPTVEVDVQGAPEDVNGITPDAIVPRVARAATLRHKRGCSSGSKAQSVTAASNPERPARTTACW